MPGPKDSPPAEVPAFAARLLEALPMGLAVLDGEGRVLYANPALRRLLRFSEEEFLGRDFTALGPGAEVVLDPNPPGLALARLKTPDGPRDAFLDVAALPGAADGAARVVLVRGPVERLAEERLRRGQALARVLLDAEDDAALLLDSDGAVVAVNRSGAARFGSTPEEMHGRCLCRYMPWELFEERLARLHDVFCLGRGLRFEDERDGRRLEHNFWPVLGRDGEVSLVAAFSRDVTEQHALARLREDVERIARHDIKSPLTGIVGLVRTLLRDGGLSERQRALLSAMGEAGEQVLNILNTSLDLLHMEQGDYEFSPEPVDLSELLGKVEGVLDPLIRRKRLTLAWRREGRAWPGSEPCPLMGEPRHLETLFTNLLKNAVEASPPDSRVSVSLEPEQEHWALTIHNRGSVPEAAREHFFEKYVTAEKPGGTGLGTYSARLIARTHGGGVRMRTSEPEGTYVTVLLPRSCPR